MARRPFGGTTADVAQDMAGDRVSGAEVTIWTAATGGTQLTDLQTPAAVAITDGLVTSDSNGIISFLGPNDGTSVVYADGGLGGRTKMLATDLADRVGTLESTPGGVTSVAGRTGVVVLTKSDVGLSSVDNTADTAKPVSTAQAAADTAAIAAAAADATSKVATETSRATTAEALKAPLASPTFTGVPAVPTATPGTNTTQAASTAFVAQATGSSVAQTVTNGVTTTAPSQDAVYDAIAAEAALRVGGDAAAVTTATGQAITKAALGIGYGLTNSTPNLAPIANPTFGPNLWALANFSSFNQNVGTNGAVNTSTLSPVMTCNATTKSTHTRIAMDTAVGTATSLGFFRITFDVTSTTLTKTGGFTTVNVNMALLKTDGTVQPMRDQFGTVHSSAINVLALDDTSAARTSRRYMIEIQCEDQNLLSGKYFDLWVTSDAGYSAGSVTLSNVRVEQTTGFTPALRVGFDRTPGTNCQVFADVPLGFDGSKNMKVCRFQFGPDNTTPMSPSGATVFYQTAFGTTGSGIFGFATASAAYRSAELFVNNCDLIFVPVLTNGSTEFRGNTHGGETGLTGTWNSDVQLYVDYGDGTWVQITGYDGFANNCFRAKIVTQTKFTRSDQGGAPFANVSRTYYIYNDGTIRQSRTVTFLTSQTLAACFWHMTSFSPGVYNASQVAKGFRGRLGHGQLVLAETDQQSKLNPPTQTASATATTGGVILGNFKYGLRVTAYNNDGETTPSIINQEISVPNGTSTNTVTANWSAVSGTTGYAVYFGLPGFERKVATVAAGTLTYTVTGSEAPGLTVPRTNSAVTQSTTDMISSGVADWAAYYEPSMDVVFSTVLDRVATKALTGVAEVASRLQRLDGAVVKNYWNLMFSDSSGRASVGSTTVWSGDMYYFVYQPRDPARFEQEQTIRGSAAAQLATVYAT